MTDGINNTIQDTSTITVSCIYERDLITNLSFLSQHFKTYDSKSKKHTSLKKFSSECMAAIISNHITSKHAY